MSWIFLEIHYFEIYSWIPDEELHRFGYRGMCKRQKTSLRLEYLWKSYICQEDSSHVVKECDLNTWYSHKVPETLGRCWEYDQHLSICLVYNYYVEVNNNILVRTCDRVERVCIYIYINGEYDVASLVWLHSYGFTGSHGPHRGAPTQWSLMLVDNNKIEITRFINWLLLQYLYNINLGLSILERWKITFMLIF